MRWMAAAGLQPAGPMRTIYLQFGADADLRLPPGWVVERDADFVTELQRPVENEARGSAPAGSAAPIGYAPHDPHGGPCVICASCGTENRTGSRFCDNCGAPLSSSCPTCGEPNRADARFCANCGSSLGAQAPSTPTASAEAAAPAGLRTRRPPSAGSSRSCSPTSSASRPSPRTATRRPCASSCRATSTPPREVDRALRRHGREVHRRRGDGGVGHADRARGRRGARRPGGARPRRRGADASSPGLQARAGVLTGEAAVTLGATNQGMVAGDLVNTAARLQGVAAAGHRPGRRGDPSARPSARSRSSRRASSSLKGKTSPVPAWRAVRVVARARRPGPRRRPRGAVRRPRRGAPPAQGPAPRHRPREARPRLVSVTARRHRQEPPGVGAREVHRRRRRDGLLASRPLARRTARASRSGRWARWSGAAPGWPRTTTRPPPASAIAATLAELVPDASRARAGSSPRCSRCSGVGGAAGRRPRRAVRGLAARSSSGSRSAARPSWCSRTSTGPTPACSTSSTTCSTGRAACRSWSSRSRVPSCSTAGRTGAPAGATSPRLALEPLPERPMRELLEGLVPGLPADAAGRRSSSGPRACRCTRSRRCADARRRRAARAPAARSTCRPATCRDLAVPGSLRALIASRLDALEPADRSLLQDAAVLGQSFTRGRAGRGDAGMTADDLEPRLRGLVRREMLALETDPRSPERGQYAFVQALIREVAYGTLARRERRSRHLAAARHFEAAVTTSWPARWPRTTSPRTRPPTRARRPMRSPRRPASP